MPIPYGADTMRRVTWSETGTKMKRRTGFWLLGLVAFMAAMPALAGPRGERLHRYLQERQAERQEQREYRREQGRDFSGRGRLTPEERQQLRRDIRDARDLYRREPPPPPPPARSDRY